MGLTGGIGDVGSLVEALVGMHTGQADDSILDKYDEVRRKIYHEVTDPISTDNIKRLYDQDPAKAMETDTFLQMAKRAETDKEFAHQMQQVSHRLRRRLRPMRLTLTCRERSL